MEQKNNDEIDLALGYNLLKKTIKNWLVVFYNGFQFLLKTKIIILSLIVIGVALGFLLQGKKNYEADLLLRVNFDTVSYVYSSLELLNNKVAQEDAKFLNNIGFKADTPEIRSIAITPVIKLKDIIEKYESNDRNLEAVIKNIDFTINEEEIMISETFMSDYKYHKATIGLTPDANKETLLKIVDYLNNNELLQQLRETSNRDIEEHVANNKETIAQINKVLDTYTSNESIASPSGEIYIVDKNFNIHQIIEMKIELQQEIEDLNQYLVYSQDVVVMVNNPNLTLEGLGFLGKKKTLYPFLLVFSFLFLAWVRHIYNYTKELATQSK